MEERVDSIRSLLQCSACQSPLEHADDDLRCANCGATFPVVRRIVDLRGSSAPQLQRPFYSIEPYRRFAAAQALLHEQHYRPGGFSNFIEDKIKDSLRSLREDVGAPVVEIGCGRTPMVDWAANRSDYIGVDQSIELLDSASADHPSSHFVCAALNSFPFASNSIQTIVANAVLEHVFDLEVVVGQLARCLAPNGRLYVVVPTEGGLAVDVARLYTSRRNGKLLGMTAAECRDAQRRDHCNTAYAVENALRKYFTFEREKLWPLSIGGTHLNLSKAWRLRPLR
jgi:SAM-dependent methyltransferase